MKEQIKKLRVKIDGVAQLTKESNTDYIGGSKEMDKAVDALYLAKAWLGKVLGKLGEATPYANDGSRKTVDDIEPTADKYQVEFKTLKIEEIKVNIPKYSEFLMMNYIEKVDWLRQEIQMISNQYKDFVIPENNKYFVNLFIDKSYCYLAEARFWLGFELERIRESFNSNI